jgi:hypothetical protein
MMIFDLESQENTLAWMKSSKEGQAFQNVLGTDSTAHPTSPASFYSEASTWYTERRKTRG